MSKIEPKHYYSSTFTRVYRFILLIQIAPQWKNRLLKTHLGQRAKGFTLAELLIALAILGVIATFTIPKILGAQQEQQKLAITKEAVATIAAAYQQLKLSGNAGTTTTPSNIIPYLNYVNVLDSSRELDNLPNAASPTLPCTTPCYQLHNGGVIKIGACSFNGATNLNKISFYLDPDGTNTGKKDSVSLFLYYDGRITSEGNAPSGTSSSCASPTGAPDPSADPGWLRW